MAEEDAGARRFSEQETALILRRAAEVDLRAPSLPRGGGHTLEDLASIAREAGIDPDAVRRAACLVSPRPDVIQRVFLGVPPHARVRARFPGTFPPARLADARDVIERSLERQGELHHDPTGLLWREDHGVGRTWVRVRREDDATSVEVETDRRGHLLALMVVLATLVALLLQPMGGFAGLSAVVGPLLSIVAPVAVVLAGTRIFWPKLAGPALRRAEAAAMDLGALVRPPPAGGGPRGAVEPPGPGPEPAS